MKEELRKSLTDLIDETLLELEELKKSRYAAAEIELKGPGEGIAGKPSDGDLHAKKAEDKKEIHVDIDSHKDEEDEDEKDEKDVEKGDGGDPADSEEVKRKLKGIMGKAEGKNEEAAKAEGKNEEAAKAEKDEPKDKDEKEPHKDDPEHEEKEKKMAQKLLDMHKGELKKSQEESEALLKSYVDERVKPIEDKLSTIFDLVKQIADQPVPAKGTPARAQPLLKSAEDAGEPLSKSEIASKLFELKKSGTKVDSLDITRAEMGQDLSKIVEKYKIS